MLLNEKLVYELLRKITRLFIKIPVYLKIGSKKKLYFATNFQPTANVIKNSILYVARVLDTPLAKLSVYTSNTFTSFAFLGNCWHKQKQSLDVFWLKRFSSNYLFYNFSNWIYREIFEKCQRKNSFFSKTAGFSVFLPIASNIAKNELFHKTFSEILTKKLRIIIWLSVTASEYWLSLICLLGSFVPIIKFLNWFLISLSKER